MLTILSLLLATSTALTTQALPRYSISVDGPVTVLEFTCDDPCQLDQSEIVGLSVGQVSLSKTADEDLNDSESTGFRNKRENNRSREQDGIKCVGNCDAGKRNAVMVFESKRTLREGIKVTIADGKAYFVFYSVIETGKGPATLIQQSDFWIDRPLIQLDLHGHTIEVRTAMEDSERTDSLKDR